MAESPVQFTDPRMAEFAEWVAARLPIRDKGAPNGRVFGSPGDEYIDNSGGAGLTYWVKESGVRTNTGWVNK